ncbi:ParB N-terminal domain-containing protein [Plantactinospora sp. GCM10030261]|uniref:ParB N-terminal domain-containing protein n=1 Tax=Plantactinospora sp. GCM10030261 TaxID=3273420 RepID=UPI003615166C
MTSRSPSEQRVIRLSIKEIGPPDSARSGGIDEDHVRRLARRSTVLPPVLVHAETMRLIDGVHRLKAALLRGESSIDAVLLPGALDEGFRLGVRTNIRHGRPLSRSERREAAGRIVRSHPMLSDRAIAADVGLSTRTVADIRRGVDGGRATIRIGRDGRARPLSAIDGRRRAVQVLAERPDCSLRQVAQEAGISLGTACDVRHRLRSGDDPLRTEVRPAPVADRSPDRERKREHADVGALIGRLRWDPSIRYTERGRGMLRWLSVRMVNSQQCAEVAEMVPPHSAGTLASIARECAAAWVELAEELEQKHTP